MMSTLFRVKADSSETRKAAAWAAGALVRRSNLERLEVSARGEEPPGGVGDRHRLNNGSPA
jgi:hypothetical protein